MLTVALGGPAPAVLYALTEMKYVVLPFTPWIMVDVWFPTVLSTLAMSSLSSLLQYLSWKTGRRNHRRGTKESVNMTDILKAFLHHSAKCKLETERCELNWVEEVNWYENKTPAA